MTFSASVRRAGFLGEGPELGENLFEAILRERSGVTFTVDEAEESFARLQTKSRRICLVIPELLAELDGLASASPVRPSEYPFVLSAGERRASTANTIFRDSTWRKKDGYGALRVAPADARALGLSDGDRVKVSTPTGTATAQIEISDTLLTGHISLPNGFGLSSDAECGPGVAPNELTSSTDCDWLAKTPWHKHVPARLDRLPA